MNTNPDTAHPPVAGPADVAPEHIKGLPPYVPGKPSSEVRREHGIDSITKLASNENPLGTSPRALAAMAAALQGLSIYPDPGGHDLKAALCRKLGVQPEQIVLGNGSSELLDLCARAFLAPGSEAVYSQYAFIAYPVAVKCAGATGISVPGAGYGHDLQRMADAIGEHTRLVFVANPNNPTGTLLHEAAIRAFLARVPAHVLVVLDEAYTEYLPPEHRTDSMALVREFPNVAVLRTFSKAYGLAGARVGFAVARRPVAELLNRTRLVFNVNAPAQAAAAAALDDEDFVARTYAVNRAGLQQLGQALQGLGLPHEPSFGNFVLVDFSQAPLPASDINQRLLARGIIVRPLGPYGLGRHLRITVGLPEHNETLIAALRDILGGEPTGPADGSSPRAHSSKACATP